MMDAELVTGGRGDPLLGLGATHARARRSVATVLAGYPEPTESMADPERHALLREICRALGREGVLGGIVAPAFGGAGMSYSELAAAVEEASAHAQVVASLLAFASAGVGTTLTAFGTPAQQERYLSPVLSGAALAAMGFTEPEGGSDVASMSTTARRTGAAYVLEGEKVWVDWATEADWFLIFALTDPQAGRAGISAFLVDRDAPGLETESMGYKLGFREYTTGRIRMRGSAVGRDAMLGGEGQGLEIARTALEDARIYVAARLSGCLATCLRLLRTELAGHGSRVEDQSLLSLVTTTAVALDCARFQLYRAASLKDQGRDATEEAMRAKLYASEALGEAASALVRVLGPSALLDEHPAARLFRDAKVSAVTAGSDEIMRTSVARALIR